jgi:hypothetical protein
MIPAKAEELTHPALALSSGITLGYAIQGLSPQLQYWRTLFLVCDTEGRPSFR